MIVVATRMLTQARYLSSVMKSFVFSAAFWYENKPPYRKQRNKTHISIHVSLLEHFW